MVFIHHRFNLGMPNGHLFISFWIFESGTPDTLFLNIIPKNPIHYPDFKTLQWLEE
jgi:hypothetical protein